MSTGPPPAFPAAAASADGVPYVASGWCPGIQRVAFQLCGHLLLGAMAQRAISAVSGGVFLFASFRRLVSVEWGCSQRGPGSSEGEVCHHPHGVYHRTGLAIYSI